MPIDDKLRVIERKNKLRASAYIYVDWYNRKNKKE